MVWLKDELHAEITIADGAPILRAPFAFRADLHAPIYESI